MTEKSLSRAKGGILDSSHSFGMTEREVGNDKGGAGMRNPPWPPLQRGREEMTLDSPVSSTGQASQMRNDKWGGVGMNKLKSPAASFVKEGFIMSIAFYMDIKYFY